MKNLLNDVSKFQKAYGAPCNHVLTIPTKADMIRRLLLQTEEFFELLEAHSVSGVAELKEKLEAVIKESQPAVDMTSVADALVDSMYIAVGTGLEYGIPLDSVWDAVQKSNMAKFVDGKAIRNEYGKVVKPEGWEPPDVWAAISRGTEAEWVTEDAPPVDSVHWQNPNAIPSNGWYWVKDQNNDVYATCLYVDHMKNYGNLSVFAIPLTERGIYTLLRREHEQGTNLVRF